ncbi:hypothetical protein A3K55_01930 [Candidatus Shapirobacteria bacterium RBG_13_44_7]|uniref:Uncharacterized protein n=1 Tax=Candidatus Shapirobacteria bacterium RBG_13_44_7 TaxID=1802149 RepID=A0A1F7SGJ2_9BACT|nr:MAG: hypothetical protein A3K55_01930 [Candidatus Shapirobacteria bacterium RBG_13_44_7]
MVPDTLPRLTFEPPKENPTPVIDLALQAFSLFQEKTQNIPDTPPWSSDCDKLGPYQKRSFALGSDCLVREYHYQGSSPPQNTDPDWKIIFKAPGQLLRLIRFRDGDFTLSARSGPRDNPIQTLGSSGETEGKNPQDIIKDNLAFFQSPVHV